MPLNVTVAFQSAAASAAVASGLKVQRYELHEALSELFELTIEVLSPDPALDEQAIVGQQVVIDFGDEPFLKEIHGLVRRMTQRTSVTTGDSKYEWVIVPPLWLTTRRRDHRIFQNLSIPDVVSAVLADPVYAGRIPAPARRLTGTFAVREYTVQYGETDHAFITRLLADEGIASFFDHDSGSAFTLIDDTSIAAPSLDAPIPFSDPSNQNPIILGDPGAPHVQTAVIVSSVETSTVTIRDYDFEKPDFVLSAARAAGSGEGFANEASLEAYGFEVGAFTLQAPGDQRAAAMLEGERSARRVLRCTASFALPPGTAMALADHPRPELASSFLVVRTRSVVDFGKASIRELTLLDQAQRFRPPRPPKPRIHGTQTAVVVGAQGEEIDVDRFGRVEIEFRWDRRDLHTGGTSRRVRVAQGWAGAGYGLVTLPRVKDEVIVAYLDGDPDEPIIVGRVHNAVSTTPLALPADKTVSVWRSKSSPGGNGFNQVLFDDLAGAERLWLHAQRDFRSETGRNSDTTVGVNQTLKVGGSQSMAVAGGQNTTVGGDVHLEVTGTYNAKAAGMFFNSSSYYQVFSLGNLSLSTEGERLDVSAVKHHIESKGIFLKGEEGIQLVAPRVHVFAGTEIHLQVGGSSIHITEGGIKIQSGGPVEVNGSFISLN
jgi:type VI secretion system secreted protein VgrG